MITFKALHGAAPNYITDLNALYTWQTFLDPLVNCYFLHLNLILRLMVASLLLLIAAPSVWNALPVELRSCNSLSSFESKLKTWLFKVSYHVVL